MPRRITIHEEDYARLLKMERADAGLVLQNKIRTLNGEPVEIIGNDYIDFFSEQACQKMMRFIELSERQAKNGKKGGAPIGNNNRKQARNNPETTQKQAKTSPNTNTNTNTNINKKTYGECANVFLSDEEFQKIRSAGLENLIEELSLYIAGTGKKYKSHYAVIRQWGNRRAKEAKPKPTQFTQGVTNKTYDFSELEARLVKN